MKIVTIHPYFLLDKKYFGSNLMIFNKIIPGSQYSIWCLKKPKQYNFTIQGQQRIGFSSVLCILFNLFKEAHKIDLLHMYHIFRWSFLGAIIYKLRNKKGKVYIKTDMSLFKEEIDNRDRLSRIPRFIMNIFLKRINYIGFEDRVLQKFMQNLYPQYKSKIILTLNGTTVNPMYIGNLQKEKTISLCGRFGSEQKNYELLLTVLEQYNINFLEGYKIYLIGNSTPEFDQKLSNLLVSKPGLQNIIVQCGFISDKVEQFDYLSRSTIFLHTANFEGDPNVQYDAMFCGCYMVSTDIANIKQNYPQQYSTFYSTKDEQGLYSSLKKAINITEKLITKDYIEIQDYYLNNFTREKSLGKIKNLLE